VPFCQRFRRLFDLAENKLHSVATMFSLGWGGGWKCLAVEEEVVGVGGRIVSGV
jgi:hypothetical protein